LALKRAAMQLKIPIVAGVQLNRQVESRKEKHPTLADFRDSGRLEEIADLALGLHRPGFYDRQVIDNELQVFCLKNRNGPRSNYCPSLGCRKRSLPRRRQDAMDASSMIFTAPYSVATLGNLAAHFHAEHLNDLRSSGLNDETIRASGVYSVRPCDLAHFFFARAGVPAAINSALCFPYQGGEFARIKLFPSLEKMKYAQPPKTGARLYSPFRVSEESLFLCEGEKKTLAAYQSRFNAVGVGGVWNWLSHGEPVDDLKAIDWDRRECTIIPD
jgi:hypothetical protein